MAVLGATEMRHLAASEATSGAIRRPFDRPSPAESVLRKPFERLSEVARTEEPLPDSGVVCRLCDKDASV